MASKQFTVRGIMGAGGLASAFGGNLAVMDVYAAQKVFGRGRKFDRIDLAFNEGHSVERGREELSRLLGAGFQVEPPSTRGQQFESVLRVYTISMSITSAFALVIGMFIIYNAFSIAVTQRRSEIGILRALGATRRQVRTLFLAESAAAGIVGSVGGLGFGWLIAQGMAGYIGQMLQGVYGVAQHVEEVATDPSLMALGLLMGISTSVVAAVLPARSAARVDPIQALQKGKYQVLSAGENRARRYLALGFVLVSVGSLLLGTGEVSFYAGFLLAVFAALLLAPALALWLTRALRPLLRVLRPVEGALAADSLIQAPRRTSATVSALMLSLAVAIGMGGLARASHDSIADWVETALDPDLFVTPSPTLTSRDFLFPAFLAPTLRQVEGVAEVQSVRTPRVMFRQTPVMIVAIEMDQWSRHGRRRVVEGDEEQMFSSTAAGRTVILSEHLASLKGIHAGDRVEIDSPTGPLSAPVAGIIKDWSDQRGVIFMDRSLYRKYWNDDRVNVFRVYLEQGASPSAVRQSILERLSGNRRLFVLTNDDVRKYILDLTDQWLGLAYAQIAIAVLVAVLGILNTLTVSITDRRRELGVLQAVGARRAQIRHTVWMEAVTIGLVGLALGLALGAVNLKYVLEMSYRDISGMSLPYLYPWSVAALLVPIILGAAFLAALWPAERAVRGSLVQALEYE